ncbi:MAG: TatD family hydrolase [Chloroflexi bacterium]|nr:TatD family hydrolase [Chloroflexota bacterium]MDA1003044.1 TatD family hydrolase [Chloroflexota bacterium]
MPPPAPRPVEPLPGVIDAHAHTWSREFDDDYDATIARAWDAGLAGVVEVGVDTDTSLRCLDLARRDERVHAVAGLHPHEASRLDGEREGLRALVGGGGFVAVGEIGLDFYRNLSPPDAQYAAFDWQLDLARETALPVVIHSRNADEESFAVLAGWAERVGRYLGPDREIGMMHCYAGSAELAARYVALGFAISIPGTVTYANNARGREVACTIPLAAMVLETDCPSLTPVPRRGQRNEPAYVVETARFVAEQRGCSPAELVRATSANAARLFAFALPDAHGSER